MSDAALQNALARRVALGDEIQELARRVAEKNAEFQRLNRFIHMWHEFAGTGGGAEPSLVPDTAHSAREKNPPKEHVATISAGIIKERGRPIARSELYGLLKQKGVELYGKDPEMVLSTMLWRMDKLIVRLQGYGYWIAEEPYPPANYFLTNDQKELADLLK